MEINTKERYNPISQDINKNGTPRIFTYGTIPFHYGCISQTWEDQSSIHPTLKLYGDNDPLDAVNLSRIDLKIGDIVEVKILGALALIDTNELDWKILVLDTRDPLAINIKNIYDLESIIPGITQTIINWFMYYKTTYPTPITNSFAYEGEVLSPEIAIQVIDDTHLAWKRLFKSNFSGWFY